MEIEMNVSMVVGLSVVAFVLCCLCGGLVFVGARNAAAKRAADGAAFRAAARGASVDEDKQQHDRDKKDADD
jgi:hypothetical protein